MSRRRACPIPEPSKLIELVILQGIDAAGEDGTIRHVMSGVNPQYPSLSDEDRQALREARAALVAQAPPGAPADPFQAASAGDN